MPDVPKHGWTHRPRSQGGTDPIEIESAGGGCPWATATMFQASISDSGGYYRAVFDTMATNSPSTYELNTDAWGVEIQVYGYYRAIFGVDNSTIGAWGANDTMLEPIVEITGTPTEFDTVSDLYSDWNIMQASRSNEQRSTDVAYNALFQIVTFNYESGVGNGLGDESPLKLGLRVLTGQTGAKSISAQIHVERLDDAGYTLTDLDA